MWTQILIISTFYMCFVICLPSYMESLRYIKNNALGSKIVTDANIDHLSQENKSPIALSRKKRQKGGKFEEAANVTNLKLMRMYLTLFKNLVAKEYVGGAHPFHPDVPKYFAVMMKQGFLDFFFPPPKKSTVS